MDNLKTLLEHSKNGVFGDDKGDFEQILGKTIIFIRKNAQAGLVKFKSQERKAAKAQMISSAGFSQEKRRK